MNILNSVLGALGGGSGDQNPLMTILSGMLASNNESGTGLGALIQQFQNSGLDDLVQSWIGTGQNLPISAEQIMQALGGDRVGDMAAQAGLSTEEASGQLADMLPQLIDKLTPGGQLPSGSLDINAIGSVLGGLLGRR